MKVNMAILLLITFISYCFSKCYISPILQESCRQKGQKADCIEVKFCLFKRGRCRCGCL